MALQNTPDVAYVHIESALVLMNRIQGLGDEDTAPANITQSDISSITYAITDSAGDSVEADTLDKTVVIFDELKTAGGWNRWLDSEGFNFRWVIPGGTLPSVGSYGVEITLTDTDGNKIVIEWTIIGRD